MNNGFEADAVASVGASGHRAAWFGGLVAIGLLAGASATLSGCGSLGPSTTSVRLVNNGDFAVQVRLYFHDDQNVLEGLIDDVGQERNYTIQDGEQVNFSQDCDDLQAIMIDDADLLVLGGLGPEEDTRVYRDGSDFGCGDTLTFTFTNNELATDLEIGFAVDPG